MKAYPGPKQCMTHHLGLFHGGGCGCDDTVAVPITKRKHKTTPT